MPGHRVELLEGRIVVGPAPIKLHNRIVTWLSDSLQDVCAEHQWDRLTHGTVELPATSERIQPDLFICPADQSTDGEWFIPAKNVLLAAEVVSLRSEALAFGDKLDLPEPFGITLDATTIPRSQESRGGAGPLPT